MEMRLALPRRAAGQPFERDALLALEIVVEAKLRRVVAGERDHERAFLAQPDRHARRLLQLAAKPGHSSWLRRLRARRSSSPGSASTPGGEHAGGGPARAAAGLVALEDGDGRSPPRPGASRSPGRSRRRR